MAKKERIANVAKVADGFIARNKQAAPTIIAAATTRNKLTELYRALAMMMVSIIKGAKDVAKGRKYFGAAVTEVLTDFHSDSTVCTHGAKRHADGTNGTDGQLCQFIKDDDLLKETVKSEGDKVRSGAWYQVSVLMSTDKVLGKELKGFGHAGTKKSGTTSVAKKNAAKRSAEQDVAALEGATNAIASETTTAEVAAEQLTAIITQAMMKFIAKQGDKRALEGVSIPTRTKLLKNAQKLVSTLQGSLAEKSAKKAS